MRAAFALLLAACAAATSAAETLSPPVAAALREVQDLYRAHRYPAALARIARAAALPGQTADDTRVIEEMQGAVAAAAGDLRTAAQAYEALLASGALPRDAQQRYAAALAGADFRLRDYAGAVRAARRHRAAGGDDPDVRTLEIQSSYLSGDCRAVVAALKPAARAGSADTASLQMLADCAGKTHDADARVDALAALAADPKQDVYREHLFDAIRARPGYLSALDLDIGRLRIATGSLTTAAQITDVTELALVAGMPAEAKQVIDAGFASGVLGRDARADRARRLQALVERRLRGDNGGNDLPVDPVDRGFDRVYAGQPEQGIAAIGAALEAGAAHPELARLRLGEAYYVAGRHAEAVRVFRTVQGSGGTAELARVWARVAQARSG